MSFDNVLANVQSGKADIAISGISATEERQKIFDFSDTYYESETVLVVKKDATGTYKQTGDFAKKSVAVQKGSIQEISPKPTCQMLMWYPWRNLAKPSMN